VDALLDCAAIVRTLDNCSTGRLANLEHCRERIEIVQGDIRDMATCRTACGGVELVFHEAALGSVQRSIEDPATTLATNVCGTANVSAAARDARVRRVIYASSSSVYGDSTVLPKREGEEGAPLSPYAASKVIDEEIAEVFARCYGMELIGTRYFNVYGPRQNPDGPYAAVIPRFFKAYATGQAAIIYGDGEQSRDFTFVADAVAPNLRAALAPAAAAGRAYNVASGRRTTVNELARTVREALGGGPEAKYAPPRPGEVRDSEADLSRSREQLGYAPEVPLREGIARSRPHYLSQDSRVSRESAPRGASGR